MQRVTSANNVGPESPVNKTSDSGPQKDHKPEYLLNAYRQQAIKKARDFAPAAFRLHNELAGLLSHELVDGLCETPADERNQILRDVGRLPLFRRSVKSLYRAIARWPKPAQDAERLATDLKEIPLDQPNIPLAIADVEYFAHKRLLSTAEVIAAAERLGIGEYCVVGERSQPHRNATCAEVLRLDAERVGVRVTRGPISERLLIATIAQRPA